jgi:peptidoglycan hydrolase-like protein with peptidoglycan-binding domain
VSQVLGDRGAFVRTVQCLLRNNGRYGGPIDGVYDAEVARAVSSYKVSRGIPAGPSTTRSTWVALLSDGSGPVLKYGSASVAVRRLQRGLNAADQAGLRVTGFFNQATTSALMRYQRSRGRTGTGVANGYVWRPLHAGVH